jgi:hypothetical protein
LILLTPLLLKLIIAGGLPNENAGTNENRLLFKRVVLLKLIGAANGLSKHSLNAKKE